MVLGVLVILSTSSCSESRTEYFTLDRVIFFEDGGSVLAEIRDEQGLVQSIWMDRRLETETYGGLYLGWTENYLGTLADQTEFSFAISLIRTVLRQNLGGDSREEWANSLAKANLSPDQVSLSGLISIESQAIFPPARRKLTKGGAILRYEDGAILENRGDGVLVETRPDGTRIEHRP